MPPRGRPEPEISTEPAVSSGATWVESKGVAGAGTLIRLGFSIVPPLPSEPAIGESFCLGCLFVMVSSGGAKYAPKFNAPFVGFAES